MKTLLKTHIFLTIFFCSGLFMYGQNTADEIISANFDKQLLVFPQEKIYAHTDKTRYMAGEDIWFRIYLVDYTSNAPVFFSRYVYAELVSPDDSVILRIKLRPEDNVFKGYINLPTDMTAGDYQLRFYTRYMEELGEEYFFRKEISIGHLLSSKYRIDASFSHEKTPNEMSAILKFQNIDDDAPFVPAKVEFIGAGGEEKDLKINPDGSANIKFDTKKDIDNNTLNIRYEDEKFGVYNQYISIPVFQDDFHVSFFPEGGDLPAETLTRIGFKSILSNGMGEKITGTVINLTNDTIANFMSNHLGMGSFVFAAKQGEKYHAICRNGYGAEKQFILPETKYNAFSLRVEWNKDTLSVDVIHSPTAKLPESLHLIVQCRGVLLYSRPWNNEIFFKKEHFPSGILHILLLDKDFKPLSERLCFNFNEWDMAKAEIETEKKNYSQREHIQSVIKLKTTDDFPVEGNFSVSVTDNKYATPDTTNNILTAMLLTSDLKGYVETPNWYFENDNLNQLDNLLLTQGWSRYNIPKIIEGKIYEPQKQPETEPEISGSLASGFFLQNKGKGYLLSINPVNHHDDTEKTRGNIATIILNDEVATANSTFADENGHFRLKYPELPNGMVYMVQVLAPDKSLRAEMNLNPENFPVNKFHIPLQYKSKRTDLEKYMQKTSEQFITGEEENPMTLDEVKIVAKRRGISPASLHRETDKIVSLKELDDRKHSASSLLTLFRSLGVKVGKIETSGESYYFNKNNEKTAEQRRAMEAGNNDYPYFLETTHSSHQNPEIMPVMIDEQIVVGKGNYQIVKNKITGSDDSNWWEYLLSIPTDYVKEIEIIKCPAPAIFASYATMPVNSDKYGKCTECILVTTKAHNGGFQLTDKNRQQIITPLGYQKYKEFYAPHYETEEQIKQQKHDTRTTIYWNPDIKTNEEGEAVLDFYSADNPTNYSITIEGITSEGLIFRKTKKIDVK